MGTKCKLFEYSKGNIKEKGEPTKKEFREGWWEPGESEKIDINYFSTEDWAIVLIAQKID